MEMAKKNANLPNTKEKVKDIKSDESPRFTLEQLVDSDRYRKYAYLLEIYLKDGESYSLEEVDKLIGGLITR